MNDCAECIRKHTCDRSFFKRRAEDYRNDEAMKKFFKTINGILKSVDLGKSVKKHNLTPYELNELLRYGQDLHEQRPIMVLDEKIKDFFVKCGFQATEDSIGWIVE